MSRSQGEPITKDEIQRIQKLLADTRWSQRRINTALQENPAFVPTHLRFLFDKRTSSLLKDTDRSITDIAKSLECTRISVCKINKKYNLRTYEE